jgi:CDP-diacylglycerol--glycerol-3-phosphate 3-phosphatidyltransferase/cardiolipin synthase
VKPRFAVADVLTALRLPLAGLFPFVRSPAWQLAIVAAVAATDVADGFLARRYGASRVGVVLDPIADKAFMAVAFVTVARRGLLEWYELVGVLLRDLLAILGFLATWVLRRPVALPARAGGKAVTIAQLLTLVAAIADSPHGRTARRRGMRVIVLLLVGLLAAQQTVAQEFVPPKSRPHSGTRIGLFGFGVRGGADLRGAGQLLLGTTLDVGDLFSSRVRLRPSAEIGVFNGPNTYVGNFDTLWRFTEDEEVATPYIGLGLSVAGREGCGADPQCPDLWLNLTFGFELHFRSTFNWLLEYRAMDALHRHRVYVGLTTRRGN